MAIAFVAGATANNNTGAAVTGSLGTTAAGQLIVITISDDSAGTSTVTSVTDTYGNTWNRVDLTAAGDVLANSSSTQMWYAVLAAGKAGASHTVTVNWNTAATGRVAVAAQYFNGFTGTPTIDQIVSTTGSGTSASPGTSGTTANANELVVIGAGHDGLTAAFSLGAGYTNLTTVNVANAAVGQESKVVAATGAQTGTMGIAASRLWGAILVTFYDQPASVTATPPTTALALTTYAPAVTVASSVVPAPISLSLTTFAPVVTATINQLAVPGVRALVLTTYAPAVGIGQNVTPGVRALVLTTYAPAVLSLRKPQTSYSPVSKPPTAYGRPDKPQTPYSRTSKPPTAYRGNPDVPAGLTLDSLTVTLDSLTVYLNGYLTATVGDALRKERTAYTPVSKPPTAYR